MGRSPLIENTYRVLAPAHIPSSNDDIPVKTLFLSTEGSANIAEQLIKSTMV